MNNPEREHIIHLISHSISTYGDLQNYVRNNKLSEVKK
ncbi:hypothetical protein RV12_GL001722 [Enterococcus quebecensis]|nr:hypothetical protein RV12_GL001722 [Enterococcus quebecensis]